jgi:hypothetical protein
MTKYLEQTGWLLNPNPDKRKGVSIQLLLGFGDWFDRDIAELLPMSGVCL